MKTKITTLLLFLTAVMFLTNCGSKTSESKKENKTTEKSAHVKFQCPMKCEGKKTYDIPGQCPVCNMDLEKMESNHENHEHHQHDSTHINH